MAERASRIQKEIELSSIKRAVSGEKNYYERRVLSGHEVCEGLTGLRRAKRAQRSKEGVE